MARPSHVSRESRQFYSREYCWSHYRHEEKYRVNQRYQSCVDATDPTHHERGNPYDRQSSRTNFNATATSYIRVTQNLKRRVEIASPYEGHTSRTFYTRLLDSTSGLLRHTSGLPKILPRLRLTLLTMLGLWGVPYERPRLVDAPRTTPTHYLGGRA